MACVLSAEGPTRPTPPEATQSLHASIHRLVFILHTQSGYRGLKFRLPGQWATCSKYYIACCGPPGQHITSPIGIGEYMHIKHAPIEYNTARPSTSYILHQIHHEVTCMHIRFSTKARLQSHSICNVRTGITPVILCTSTVYPNLPLC